MPGRSKLRKYPLTGAIPPNGTITSTHREHPQSAPVYLCFSHINNQYLLDFLIFNQNEDNINNMLTLEQKHAYTLKHTLDTNYGNETTSDVLQTVHNDDGTTTTHDIQTTVVFIPTTPVHSGRALTIRIQHPDHPDLTLEFTPKQTADLWKIINRFCTNPDLSTYSTSLLDPKHVTADGTKTSL